MSPDPVAAVAWSRPARVAASAAIVVYLAAVIALFYIFTAAYRP